MAASKDHLFAHLLGVLLLGKTGSVTRTMRIRATFAYVKTLQVARQGIMGLLGLSFLLLLVNCGLLVFHIGLFFYLPWSLQDKGLLLMILGGSYVLLTLLGCAFALSQRRWMRKTGADKAVRNALLK
jgi:hypothetical protein